MAVTLRIGADITLLTVGAPIMTFTTGWVVARNCFSTALTCRMPVGLRTTLSLTSVVMVVDNI